MYFLYHLFLDNVCDSRAFISFAIKQIHHVVSSNQQSQSSLKGATLGKTIIDNSLLKDQVENQTDVKTPVKVGCDTVGTKYIIMHNVLREHYITVVPVVFF